MSNGNPIVQTGSVTPGHAAIWTTDGAVQDAGAGTAGNITELGITKNGGVALGINSASTAGPFVQFGISVSSSGAVTLSANGYAGAPVPTLSFDINGTVYPFPGPEGPYLPLTGGLVGIEPNVSNVLAPSTVQLSNMLTLSTASSPVTVGFAAVAAVNGENNLSSGFQAANVSMYSQAVTTGGGDVETFYVYSRKDPVTGGIPGGSTQSSMLGIWNVMADNTNGDTATYGGMFNEFDIFANGSDTTNGRINLNVILENQLASTSGGYPAEFFTGMNVYSGAYCKALVTLQGYYTRAGLDLRRAGPQQATVLTSLGSASTTLHVSNVLNFTSATQNLTPISSGNPLAVYIGSNTTPYSCIGWAFDSISGGTQPSSGTLTFSSAVSTTDGTAGNYVTPLSFAIWMLEGTAMAFNNSGNSTISAPDSANLNINVKSGTLYLNSTVQASGSVYAGTSLANHLVFSGIATGGDPTIKAIGSDTNVTLLLQAQGTGQVAIQAPIGAPTLQASTSYANDAAAATGGVPVGQFYRNGSVVQCRIS